MKLVDNIGNWKIIAHIAFKFYSVASGTFSTGSTFSVSGVSTSTSKNLYASHCPLHASVREHSLDNGYFFLRYSGMRSGRRL